MSPIREPRTRRARKTRVSVRVGEVLSRLLITIGGIGTIAAVVLMFVFLVAVAFPLFSGAHIEEPRSAALGGERPVKLLADEQSTMAALLEADGAVVVHRLADGSVLERLEPFGSGGAPTAWSFAPSGGSYTYDVERLLVGEAAEVVGPGQLTVGGHSVALGFADGTVRTGVAGFASTFPRPESLPEALRALAPGEEAPYAGGILQCTGEGNFRWQFFALELGAAAPTAHPSPVRLLAHSPVDDGGTLVAWHEDGSFAFVEVTSKVDWMTDEVTLETEEAELPTEDVRELGMPGWLMLSGTGDHAFAIWADGRMARWNVAFPERARIVETGDLVSEPDARVTAATFLVGKTTLMVGDSLGRVRGWFCIKPEDAGTADGAVLELAHELQPVDSPVTALATAPRSRVVASGHADGSVWLSYMTTGDSLGHSVAPAGEPIEQLELVPREEGLVAAGGGQLAYWELDLRYPEASLAAFFRPVWYEGYLAPGHTWQSEGATDDFEPKFGFLPLVFGTLKATVYSMLFGAPLALLAALYTSEFLSRKLRSSVKSIIEMMASLPSVVLGFLAGVVIAPFAASVLPATLALLLTLPASLLLGAYVWQLLPSGKSVAWSGWQRLFCMFLALPVGIFAASLLGPLLERVLFAGSLELWLDGQVGSAFGGWLLTLFPLSALLVFVFFARVVNPWIRGRSASWERRRAALTDLAKFGLGGAATIVLALALAWSLDLASLDPRESIFGTYDSRNALVVGFVMGFAIIPIIYTLADDALTGVPEHLRRASLGAGATPWQTAVRVVIPTAMSGLFSAIMIGLGRAVGETMIVLMAVGNTPIMEWNIFNGFRTLSANIAVEMPEAVQNSTHYRTLFFAALVLFAMTFVLNTVAEIVRLRYRRRAVQL